jgi:glycosyltransferase involved in cell wall biosynthesis
MSRSDAATSGQPHRRGEACVVLAASGEEHLQACLRSAREHAHTPIHAVSVPASAATVNEALEQIAPADAVVLTEPCLFAGGWLQRLRAAALSDTNAATASALADAGTELALLADERQAQGRGAGDLAALADGLAERTLALRPRLSRAVGPCVYVRREAIELVGPLDETLGLNAALEIDFAQRCLLGGLFHVAADDVVVGRLAGAPRPQPHAPGSPADGLTPELLERYPHLAESAAESAALGESSLLAHALRAARGADARLWVTIDARALEGAVTGTQVHILELIRALADTATLRLRLLVRERRIDRQTLALLRSLPCTELLAEDDVDERTPRSTVFHRPQQAFAPEDVQLALRLGERIVLSQLDLIAYRNPGYFADADAWQAYRRASRHGMSAAERVLVFSEHTRRELIADALVEEQRIRVVAPGLDHRSVSAARRPAGLAGKAPADADSDADAHSDADAGAEAARAEPRGFLLCLGTDFRHKNRGFALRLLAALRERHGWSGSLVLAGTHIPHGSSRELEQTLLDEHPALREAVIELGAVDEQEKTWLMRRAAAVVYPSVYEGFGLVPFEAALNGVPCLFAAQSSLAEAAPQGTATILPWDAQTSAAAAHALLCEPAARERQVQALAAAAARFTWAAAAGEIVGAYREAAAAPVREAATLSRDVVARERRLSGEHQAIVDRLIGEREHAQRMYDELNAQVGFGLSLIGPNGSLPDGLQRALLAIAARPALRRLLYGPPAALFVLLRALGRAVGAGGRGRT